MKISRGFVLRNVVGENIVLPIGLATIEFDGMIRLNETGAFLWHLMQQDITREVLAQKLTKEYNVSLNQAARDVDEFISQLEPLGCIEYS